MIEWLIYQYRCIDISILINMDNESLEYISML